MLDPRDPENVTYRNEVEYKSAKLGMRPIDQTLPILLVRARETLMSFWRPILAELGFTEPQWRVLRVVAELGPIDISTLADRTALHMPSVTRILHTLEDSGHVLRKRDEDDTRRSWIEVTDKTTDTMASVATAGAEAYGRLGRRFEQEKMDELLALLESFCAIEKGS